MINKYADPDYFLTDPERNAITDAQFEDKAVVTGNARVQNARKEIIQEENEKAQTE